jgi:hypothetical protein
MQSEEEGWVRTTEGGLFSSTVAADIVDGDDELVKQENHPRRIAFMLELIAMLPDERFAPASREQLDEALLVAADYWNKRATDEQRKQAREKLRVLLGKNNPSNWDYHSLPLWTLQTEESFNWMWYQWFECVWSCIPDERKRELDAAFTALLQKHFPGEIQTWVDE